MVQEAPETSTSPEELEKDLLRLKEVADEQGRNARHSGRLREHSAIGKRLSGKRYSVLRTADL